MTSRENNGVHGTWGEFHHHKTHLTQLSSFQSRQLCHETPTKTGLMKIPQWDVLSGQSLDGGEAADKKNGEHIVELSDSLLEWIIGIAGPHTGGPECQAKPTAGLAGDKPSTRNGRVLRRWACHFRQRHLEDGPPHDHNCTSRRHWYFCWEPTPFVEVNPFVIVS